MRDPIKINTSHLVGAVIALAVVFLTSLDTQDQNPQAKIERQKWEYAELFRFMPEDTELGRNTQMLILPEGQFPEGDETTLPYGLSTEWESWKGDLNRVKNTLGEDGWEACYQDELETILGTYFRIYFKRPKQ
ncbi:hypothetical protein N8612_05655 [Verrucomicrobia bacterium]|nr:hypothetical protein [Verrucomicrobiota bacterium]